MRRIDRILFSALGHGVNENIEISDGSNLQETSAPKTPVLVTANAVFPSDGNIPEASSGFETEASKDMNYEDERFQESSNRLFSPATLALITPNEKNNESPAAPAFSPLTPLAKKEAEKNYESPAAPAFSPLTPLAKKEAEKNYESPAAPAFSPLTSLAKQEAKNGSPIPPMSPSTLELFETLSRDFSTVEHEYFDLSNRRRTDGFSYGDLEQTGDYDDDTDSDYVPDSGEDTDVSHSSVKQKQKKNFEVPESDSSENETIQEGSNQTHIVMVHDNQTRTNRNTQTPLIGSNAIYNDATTGDLSSVCQGSNTESILHEVEAFRPVPENNNAVQAMGRLNRGHILCD